MYKIVAVSFGWVLVGKVTENKKGLLVEGAIIRQWGTSKGLPELVGGPTKQTLLDKSPVPLNVPFNSVIFTLDIDEKVWGKALS